MLDSVVKVNKLKKLRANQNFMKYVDGNFGIVDEVTKCMLLVIMTSYIFRSDLVNGTRAVK